jgi:hypothetical protein
MPANCGYYLPISSPFAGICYNLAMKLQKRSNDILSILFPQSVGTARVLEKMAENGLELSEDTLQRELRM